MRTTHRASSLVLLLVIMVFTKAFSASMSDSDHCKGVAMRNDNDIPLLLFATYSINDFCFSGV